MLLTEIANGPGWWERMCEKWPAKMVRSAAIREAHHVAPMIDYGVCVERSFLTDMGRRYLAQQKEQQ
jgi:hypothetical protein